jgi:hypothetical protein
MGDVVGVVAIEDGGEGGGGIGLAHEGFTDEEGIVAEGAELCDLLCAANAAFGDGDGTSGHEGDELIEEAGVHLQGAEVSGVDAEEVEPEVGGAFELESAVSLAEDVERSEERRVGKECCLVCRFFFFFQAEDGIRDTGM